MRGISLTAFGEELEKIAELSPGQTAALIGLGLPAAATAGVVVGAGKKGRAQMNREVHDPRLYSNLRGMVTLESAAQRVAAHRKLDRSKKHSVLSAMREGFTRGG